MQVKTFDFVQASASTEWTISHNLGVKPVMDVMSIVDGNLQKLFPLNVIHVDDNTTVVTFSVARAGKARLVGLTTDILRSPTDSYIEADGSA